MDYYQILGISKTATADEIKKAYRKLARKYHPDLNPNDQAAEARFKEINEANEVLSNPETRAKYDQYGEHWKNSEAYGQAQKARQKSAGSQRYSSGGTSADYSDFFSSMFGGEEGFDFGAFRQGHAAGKFKGQDIHATMSLSITDVLTEHKQTFEVNGKKIRITVPAGAYDGLQIKLAGYGGDGYNGGPKGDLYITFSIVNPTSYRVSGHDLKADVELDLYTAILGGQKTVSTPYGDIRLTVNPLTQNGTTVRVKDKGLPVYKEPGKYGNLLITFKVKLPGSLTEEEKKLFEQLKNMQ